MPINSLDLANPPKNRRFSQYLFMAVSTHIPERTANLLIKLSYEKYDSDRRLQTQIA
jgi:hypothetical protein